MFFLLLLYTFVRNLFMILSMLTGEFWKNNILNRLQKTKIKFQSYSLNMKKHPFCILDLSDDIKMLNPGMRIFCLSADFRFFFFFFKICQNCPPFSTDKNHQFWIFFFFCKKILNLCFV